MLRCGVRSDRRVIHSYTFLSSSLFTCSYCCSCSRLYCVTSDSMSPLWCLPCNTNLWNSQQHSTAPPAASDPTNSGYNTKKTADCWSLCSYCVRWTDWKTWALSMNQAFYRVGPLTNGRQRVFHGTPGVSVVVCPMYPAWFLRSCGRSARRFLSASWMDLPTSQPS